MLRHGYALSGGSIVLTTVDFWTLRPFGGHILDFCTGNFMGDRRPKVGALSLFVSFVFAATRFVSRVSIERASPNDKLNP